MLTIKHMTDDDLQYIIGNKDISEEIKKYSENVLTIFTQDWCKDWEMLNREIEKNLNTTQYDITIFLSAYNHSKHFDNFRDFKETHWANNFIPYLRYYKNGELIKETNQLPLMRVLKTFN